MLFSPSARFLSDFLSTWCSEKNIVENIFFCRYIYVLNLTKMTEFHPVTPNTYVG